MATLQNLKNNGLGYYPCLVGGKLHVNRGENLYKLVRNDAHQVGHMVSACTTGGGMSTP